MTNVLGRMNPTPGRKKTRRIEEPNLLGAPRNQPGMAASRLVSEHNNAVRRYGSNSGGFHAFNVVRTCTAGVWDGTGGYPDGTVVTRLSWGFINERLAQRLLEADGHDVGNAEISDKEA